MGYSVFYGDPAVTIEAGFGRVARLPCILDSRPGYHRLGSRYLIDRGIGAWNPASHTAMRRQPPSRQSMRNYAYWLANFLEWAELRNRPIVDCNYFEDIHDGYQREMLSGAWSRDGVGLSARTVNLRVELACDFLAWMATAGHRRPFDIPREILKTRRQSGPGAIGQRSSASVVRKGRVRQDKRRLRMPTDEQVAEWLDSVYDRFGQARGLMCETVLLTAARREEVASWRVDTLPQSPEFWQLSQFEAPSSEQRVLVKIRYGTKGPDYGFDHGDKVGPERSIWIPSYLAGRIHEYRSGPRAEAVKKWVRGAQTLAERTMRRSESVHLFHDEKTGSRLTAKDLYNAWVGGKLPFKGWSPHLGRDWWACSVLWCELRKRERWYALGLDGTMTPNESSALDIILLQVQPQLGHANSETSMVYLQWLVDALGVTVTIPRGTAQEAIKSKSRIGEI